MCVEAAGESPETPSGVTLDRPQGQVEKPRNLRLSHVNSDREDAMCTRSTAPAPTSGFAATGLLIRRRNPSYLRATAADASAALCTVMP